MPHSSVPEPETPRERRKEFQARVRAWFEANAPGKGSPDDFSAVHVVSARTPREYHDREQRALTTTRRWQRRLFDAGLAGRSWPTDYGGQGRRRGRTRSSRRSRRSGASRRRCSPSRSRWCRRCCSSTAPTSSGSSTCPRSFGASRAGASCCPNRAPAPTWRAPRRGPTPVDGGAGRSRARRCGRPARQRDFALLVARTDQAEAGRAGLSCFALDMHQPGIDVRPLRQMSGAYHFNEVFLDDAFVPEHGLIGAWARAGPCCGRCSPASGPRSAAARARGPPPSSSGWRSGSGAADDSQCADLIAAAVVRERLLDLLRPRIAAGHPVAAAGSVTKLLYSEHAPAQRRGGPGSWARRRPSSTTPRPRRG